MRNDQNVVGSMYGEVFPIHADKFNIGLLLREMQMLTSNHKNKVGDPYGRIRRRIEGDEGDGNPTGRSSLNKPKTQGDPKE